MSKRKRLGDILRDQGLISTDQLEAALEMQLQSGEKLGEALIELGFVSADIVADALSEHLNISRVDFSQLYLAEEVVNLIPESFIKAKSVLPIGIDGEVLSVAMVDPLNITVIDDLRRMTKLIIKPMIATAEEISGAFRRTRSITQDAREVFERYQVEEKEQVEERQYLGDAPGVRLANMILQQAVAEKASDVHLEPDEEGMRVRIRIDGLLREMMEIPKSLRGDVNSRIKIMANLDITERRRPQDGRIQMKIDDQEVDMRISSLPTVHGEKIVARILHKSKDLISLNDFGFSPESQRKIEMMLRPSQGLVLVTGPTGSGKSTTLYGFLNRLNSPKKNIVTVEDPVEYQLAGVNQVQVNPKADLTFATGLRAVLRQDPDVIMVGEIRDEETAEIAVRSALTGHLVLSTVHTNSAVATITRLMNMQLEPYILSSTIIGIVAQRLVRTICSDCREQVRFTDRVMLKFLESLEIEPPQYVYQGKGCPFCGETGYRGRTVVDEVLLFNKELRSAVEQSAAEAELREIALRSGMVTLQEAAAQKMISGITTAAEIIRTVYSIEMEGDVP
ncbi:MAG: Flp pilus assembly complex ATPase component TadA [Firmicutes bacterium]|nr:Flp pilus assembly complex ATPase component TadA [Bacillota bacterium]